MIIFILHVELLFSANIVKCAKYSQYIFLNSLLINKTTKIDTKKLCTLRIDKNVLQDYNIHIL